MWLLRKAKVSANDGEIWESVLDWLAVNSGLVGMTSDVGRLEARVAEAV